MWSRAMMMPLEAKNKLGFVNGTIIEPLEKDPKYGDLEKMQSNREVLNPQFNQSNPDQYYDFLQHNCWSMGKS